MPNTRENLLPIDPKTGEEKRFIYEPQLQVLKNTLEQEPFGWNVINAKQSASPLMFFDPNIRVRQWRDKLFLLFLATRIPNQVVNTSCSLLLPVPYY